MNTSISIINDDDSALLEELYGSSNSASGKTQDSKLGVLKLVQTAKMGDMEVAGKIHKTEVIPAGAYELYLNKEKVYCINPRIRYLGRKSLWTYWDADENTMQRSLLADNLNGDLKDTMGTFNVGRMPYVKDWKKLSTADQAYQRGRKRTLLMMGIIDSDGECMDENGSPVEGLKHIPFTMEITNFDSIKGLDEVIGKINKKYNCTKGNVVDIHLGSERHEGSLPFSTMLFSIKKDAVPETLAEFISRERDTLISFSDWTKMRNTYVTDQWSRHNKEELNSEEETLVSQLVNIEGAAI